MDDHMEAYKKKWEQKIGTTLSDDETVQIHGLMGEGTDDRYDTKEHLKGLINDQRRYAYGAQLGRAVISLQNKLKGGRRRFRSTHSRKYKKMAKYYSRASRRKCKNRK